MKLYTTLKSIKAEVENQLERKIKRVRSDRGGEYFSTARNMILFMRGRLPIHLSQMGLPKERTAL